MPDMLQLFSTPLYLRTPRRATHVNLSTDVSRCACTQRHHVRVFGDEAVRPPVEHGAGVVDLGVRPRVAYHEALEVDVWLGALVPSHPTVPTPQTKGYGYGWSRTCHQCRVRTLLFISTIKLEMSGT